MEELRIPTGPVEIHQFCIETEGGPSVIHMSKIADTIRELRAKADAWHVVLLENFNGKNKEILAREQRTP